MKIPKLFLIAVLVQALLCGCQPPSPASLPIPITSEPSASPTPSASSTPPASPTPSASPIPSASPTQTPFPVTPIESEAVATLTVEGFPDLLTIEAGSVWVSNNQFGIQRIDTATNQVIATIPVLQPYGGTAAGYGSLWVHDYLNMQLVRIDLQTNEVVARIKMGKADPTGNVAAGEGGVWVLSDKEGVLSRVDPEKNEVVAEIAVNPGSFTVMTGFGSVWTTQTIGKTVQRIDPKTNQVVATIEVRLGPRYFAVGEGGVWVHSHMDCSVTRIDPNTNQVVAVIEHVTDFYEGDIAAGDGAVWVGGGDTLLTVIDPKTNQISKRYSVPDGPVAVRVRDGMVWVTARMAKKIWRLDSGQQSVP